jgi:hypothetical protein
MSLQLCESLLLKYSKLQKQQIAWHSIFYWLSLYVKWKYDEYYTNLWVLCSNETINPNTNELSTLLIYQFIL